MLESRGRQVYCAGKCIRRPFALEILLHQGKRDSHARIHEAPLSSGKGYETEGCATEEESQTLLWTFRRRSLRYQIREMIVVESCRRAIVHVAIAVTLARVNDRAIAANADTKYFLMLFIARTPWLRLASKQIRRNYALGNVTREGGHCERAHHIHLRITVKVRSGIGSKKQQLTRSEAHRLRQKSA